MRRTLVVILLGSLVALPGISAEPSAPFSLASDDCRTRSPEALAGCSVDASGSVRVVGCEGWTCTYVLAGEASGRTDLDTGVSQIHLWVRALALNLTRGGGMTHDFFACDFTGASSSAACHGRVTWSSDLRVGRCEVLWVRAKYANVPATVRDPFTRGELVRGDAQWAQSETVLEACRLSATEVAVQPYVPPPPPPAPTLHLSGSAPGSAVIVRFNVSADSDLALMLAHQECPSSDYSELSNAHAIFSVREERFAYQVVSLGGGGSFLFEESSIAAGVAGHYLESPVGNPQQPLTPIRGGCGTMYGYAWNKPGVGEPRAHVLIGATDAEVTTWNVFANFTRGVLSYDVATVPFHALTRDHFEEGAHASVRPPLFDGAGAGVALRHEIPTRSDFGGFWWPNYADLTDGGWCTYDGGPCPGLRGDGRALLSSKAGSTYAFGYDATIDTYGGGYVLQHFEFPDDTYLAPS